MSSLSGQPTPRDVVPGSGEATPVGLGNWALLGAALILLLAQGCATPEADAPPFHLSKLTEDPAGGGDATLSPDGRRFVTTSLRSGQMDIWIYEIGTDEWTQVTDLPSEDFEARFSPDGKQLVFTSTRSGTKDIWLLSLDSLAEDGGNPRRLTTSAYEDEYPIFSPDGQSVVYTGGPWGDRDFWIVPTAGGEPRKIGDARERPGGVGRVGACGFDPGGQSLVCHDYGLGTGNLLRLWLDGESVPLTLGGAWDYKPTASGDGRFVAFSRALEGPSQVWLMPSEGGRAQRLTSTPDSDRWPTWSADGSRLFFHRLVDRGAAIEVLDQQTGEVRTVSEPGEIVGQAALHPSGRELVYCALEGTEGGTQEGRHRLRIVDLAGGDLAAADLSEGKAAPARSLDIDAAEACWPRYFPDGERLALSARPVVGARWEVAVLDLASESGADDGADDLRWITTGRAGIRGMDGPIDVAPDGRSLVFHADTLAFEANLYLADLEEGTIEALTDDAWFDEAPSFTADGEGVLFMSTRGGDWTWGLFRLDLGDRSLELFAGPDWVQKNYVRPGPDGSRLWAQATDEGTEQIVRQSSPGAGGEEAEVEVLVAADEDSAAPGARWPSLSADGRFLAYTRIEHRVEYWLAENPAGPGSPIHDPAHTPVVHLAAYSPESASPTSGSGSAVGGAGEAGSTHAAPSTNRNVHSAPTPPGGLGVPASEEPQQSQEPSISPVDGFHR